MDFTANQYMAKIFCDLCKISLSLVPNFKLEDNKVGEKLNLGQSWLGRQVSVAVQVTHESIPSSWL